MVAIDHAGRVHVAGDQRPGGFALTTDMVTVQSHAHVEASDREVDAGLEADSGEVGEREKGRLWRIDGNPPAAPATKVSYRRAPPTSAWATKCSQTAAGVSHRNLYHLHIRGICEPPR